MTARLPGGGSPADAMRRIHPSPKSPRGKTSNARGEVTARRRRVAKLRGQGLSAAAIAAKVGVTVKLVEWDLRELGREGRVATPARVVGVDGREYDGRAGEELIEERALARRAAVDLAAAGWSQREIAELVGVGSSTVGRWLAAAAASAEELSARAEARRRAASTLRWVVGLRVEDVGSLLGVSPAIAAEWAPPDAAPEFPQTCTQKSRARERVSDSGRRPSSTGPPGPGGP
jgi:transposase